MKKSIVLSITKYNMLLLFMLYLFMLPISVLADEGEPESFYVTEVYVDGILLIPNEHYDPEAFVMHESYLDKLLDGTHTIEIRFSDGSSTGEQKFVIDRSGAGDISIRHANEQVVTPDTGIPNNHSPWASEELNRAAELGLIPDSLKNSSIDYTRPISRVEFAGIAVKTYEALANTTALPATNNPFIDTQETDALKAYNTGIMVGMSATEFAPNTLLNREQASTALTRAFKRATINGWTFETDANHTLNYTRPPAFADDARISAWAKESVYFMAANNIINGVGNNTFAPRAITSDERARGYAQATREQALVIAVRMIETLK
jgi:hypothetical protein